MALKPARSLPELFDIIVPIALQFQTGVIRILNPQASGVFVPYDPATDEGGYWTPAPPVYEGQARIQQLSDSDRSAGQTMNPGGVVKYRFQIPLTDIRIERGWQLEVVDGANDPTLTTYLWHVDGSVNSNVGQVRDVFATMDLESSRSETPPTENAWGTLPLWGSGESWGAA